MWEVFFLIVLGLIWIIFAMVQDLRKREIADWLNFSLIIFVLGFRFFYSLFSGENFAFFYQGVLGFGIFFFLHNLFYYGRLFAGGDAKLMWALGTIIPFSNSFYNNLKIFVVFLVLFLFVGSVYGLFVSFSLGTKNFKKFKKEFAKQFKKKKKLVYSFLGFALLFAIFSFLESSMLYFGILFFIIPYFYLAAKSIDEVCMVKKVSPNKLTEGDWLYEDVKIGNKLIKKSWDGLSKKEIKTLQKRKFVLIRYGIPFSPTFLISFLLLIYLWFNGVFSLIF